MKSVFHPAAQDEADEAARWYDAERPGLGRAFRHELAKALERIADHPQVYAMEAGGFRACPLKRFPYIVFYIDLPDGIWIGAVAHGRRRPGYWARRQPG